MIRKVLYLFLTLLTVTSCMSLQKNYLGKAISLEDNLLNASQRDSLYRKADSLRLIIERIAHTPRSPIGPSNKNDLFALFGKQLLFDRQFEQPIKKKPGSETVTTSPYLAAAQLLYSSAQYEQLYQNNKLIRRILNRGDIGNDIPVGVLRRSQRFLYAPHIRDDIDHLSTKFPDPTADSLMRLIPETNHIAALGKGIVRRNDQWNTLWRALGRAISSFSGNTAGRFQGPSDPALNASILKNYIQPFDIVLMKSPQRLTDKIIPGFFGHVAICLGTDAEYISTLAPDQDISEFLPEFKEIAMLEAVRKDGVRISRVEKFAEGKVFMILRPLNLTETQKKEILVNGLKQLYKPYDFQFDINSANALTCTEIVYLGYDFLDWELELVMSRYALSPDGIVRTARDADFFEVPLILDHGNIISEPGWEQITTMLQE